MFQFLIGPRSYFLVRGMLSWVPVYLVHLDASDSAYTVPNFMEEGKHDEYGMSNCLHFKCDGIADEYFRLEKDLYSKANVRCFDDDGQPSMSYADLPYYKTYVGGKLQKARYAMDQRPIEVIVGRPISFQSIIDWSGMLPVNKGHMVEGRTRINLSYDGETDIIIDLYCQQWDYLGLVRNYSCDESLLMRTTYTPKWDESKQRYTVTAKDQLYRTDGRVFQNFTRTVSPSRAFGTTLDSRNNKSGYKDMSSKLLEKSKQLFLPAVATCDKTNAMGYMSQLCAEQVQNIDVNTLTYLRELVELKDTISGLDDLLHSRLDTRSLSQLWLSHRYGVGLTLEDTKEVCQAFANLIDDSFDSKDWRKVSSHTNWIAFDANHDANDPYTKSWIRGQYRVGQTIIYDRYSDKVKGALRTAYEWDVFPSLQNLWDVIPYSFIADWFVDVESALKTLDSLYFIDSIGVRECCETTKVVFSSDPHIDTIMSNCIGVSVQNFTVTIFQRQLTKECRLPSPRLDASDGLTLKNGVTALALIFANR